MKNLYEKIGVETEVMQASQHRQIQMLFDRCLQLIKLSTHYIELNDITNKCNTISKAMDIVNYLNSILQSHDEQSKKMSDSLSAIYQYVDRQLLMANLKNDTKYLDEAYDKMSKIKSGWDEVGANRG